MPKEYFPRVREAREALRERAVDLFEKYWALIQKAEDSGQLDIAMEHARWLVEHMPADVDGSRMIDSSAAKPKEIEGPRGPQINIGVAIGGMKIPTQIELPVAEVLEITPLKDDKE
jgi:hypothetical protein